MAVKTNLGVLAQFCDQSRHPIGDVTQDQRTRRVDDIDALAPGVGHDPRLDCQLLRRDAVRHHQESDGLQTEFTSQAEVLYRHVGFGAMGGDAADRTTIVLRLADVLFRAHSGQHQERDPGILRGFGSDFNQLLLRGFRESVVEAGPAQTVAVGHLDHRNPGGVECGDDGLHLFRDELVPLVMGPVAQRGVGDPDVEDAVRHRAPPVTEPLCAPCLAISSPTFVAAAVMMSRFPAYGGR